MEILEEILCATLMIGATFFILSLIILLLICIYKLSKD